MPFSDVSLKSCLGRQQTFSPPREGKSFCKHLRHIYGICGITKYCNEGAGNGISFPTSVGEVHHELLQFLLMTLATSLLSPEQQSPAWPFSLGHSCVCHRALGCTAHLRAKPVSSGPPEGSISCRCTADRRRHDETEL